MNMDCDITPQVSPLGIRDKHGQTFTIVDHSGNEIERIQYLATGEIAYRQISFWTLLPSGGVKITRLTMSSDGVEQQRLEGHKDEKGRVISQVYYSPDGQVIDRQENNYADNESTDQGSSI